MHQNKSRRFARYQLMLTAVLLLACISLLAAAAWARYRTDEVSYLEYAAKPAGSVFLQAVGDQGWIFSENSCSLSFYISNGSSEDDYAQNTQTVSVRLLASLSIEEMGGETVYLSISDGESTSTYIADSVPIEEGTSLHKAFGDGRVYIFYDEKGDELSLSLAGESLSTLFAQLEISGLSKPVNPTLLQLQVVGK